MERRLSRRSIWEARRAPTVPASPSRSDPAHRITAPDRAGKAEAHRSILETPPASGNFQASRDRLRRTSRSNCNSSRRRSSGRRRSGARICAGRRGCHLHPARRSTFVDGRHVFVEVQEPQNLGVCSKSSVRTRRRRRPRYRNGPRRRGKLDVAATERLTVPLVQPVRSLMSQWCSEDRCSRAKRSAIFELSTVRDRCIKWLGGQFQVIVVTDGRIDRAAIAPDSKARRWRRPRLACTTFDTD